MNKIFAIVSVIIAFNVNAQQVEGEVELAGFVLGQYRAAVHRQLGPPIETRHAEDGWVYEFHLLKPDTSVYALFKYTHTDTTHIYAIQVNGESYEEMHPFRGVKLGASGATISRLFGKYDDTDTIQDPPVVVLYYPNKNYSFEVDDRGHLYGIQIFGNILENKPREEMHSLKHFKDAILSKNIDSLITYLAPDVEIHKNGQVIRYTGAAREEFKNRDSEFVRYLLGETGSVWYAFAREYAKGTSELRQHPEDKVLNSVDKFYGSNIISEIVFIPHAGKWKVYEIKFR